MEGMLYLVSSRNIFEPEGALRNNHYIFMWIVGGGGVICKQEIFFMFDFTLRRSGCLSDRQFFSHAAISNQADGRY
jgi:hypothetical protein